jgi:hypothetical protein
MSDLLSAAKFFFDRGIEEITLDVLKQTEDNIAGDPVGSPHPLNLRVLNKKLSHLIARSWLPGVEAEKIKATLLSGNQKEIRELMVQSGVVTMGDSEVSLFDVDPNPQPNEAPLGAFGGSIVDELDPSTPIQLIFKIPYPQNIYRDLVTEEQLGSWLATSPESEPWEPFQFSRWIPYTC